MRQKQKVIGILGGMGAEAGADFYLKVVKNTPAKTDQEHPEIILVQASKIPDRSAALKSGERKPVLDAMERYAKILENAGVDFICVPCNTAHSFLPELNERLTVSVLDMMQITSRIIAEKNLKKVGLMATDGTLAAGLYHKALGDKGIEVVTPKDQQLVMDIIYKGVKAGKYFTDDFLKILEDLKEQGVEAVILGCTELPLVAERVESPVALIDATELLAKEAVRLYLEEE